MIGLESLTDESFTHKDKSAFDLYISFDDHNASLSVWEKASNKIVAFEPLRLIPSKDSGLLSSLREALNNSNLHSFSREYRQVTIVSGLRNSTLVPNSLFDNNKVAEQQHFLHKETGEEIICVDSLRIANARSIYSISSLIYQYFNDSYNSVNFLHTSSTTIENQLSSFHNEKKPIITLIIHTNYFELIASTGKSLLLYNTFDIENTDSLIYYTLFCCEQLNLDPELITLLLCGQVAKTSAAFLTLQNYFRNIGFTKAPENITLSYLFLEKPSHSLYQTYCIPACV